MALGIQQLKRLAVVAAVGGALVAGFARPADAKPGMVKAKTGQTFQGDVDETSKPGRVIIKLANGQPVEINRGNVESVTIFNTPREEFDARLANLGKQDVAGRVALARWALTVKEPDLAAQAADSVRQIDPKNQDLMALDRQIAALRPAPASQPATQPATGPAAKPLAGPAKRVLTPDEVQLVRLREMWPDEQVKVKAPNSLKKDALAAGLLTPQQRNLREVDVALLVLRQGSPELQKQVKITSDPVALADYRNKINKVVISGCATNTCHGGPSAGRLVLFASSANAAQGEAADLTNFVVLQKFEGNGGGVQRAMIDRTSPLNSLLLGFMLPAKDNKVAHPEVPGFKSATRGPTDPTFVAAREWMGRTLIAVAPNYDDIDLTQEPKPAGDKPAAEKPAGAAAK